MKSFFFIGILALVFSGCLEEEIEGCKDTDNGTNYYLKGKVKAERGYQGEDFCYKGTNYLQEYFCHKDGSGGTQVYECKYGCKEGRCEKRG